jgi:hypothetical protein
LVRRREADADGTSARRAVPVFDPEVLEVDEVSGIGGDEHELIHPSDGGDLGIDVRCWSAGRLQPRPLRAVPGGGNLVVRQDWKRLSDDLIEIGFESRPAPSRRQTTTPIGEFVPDGGRNRTLGTVGLETLEDAVSGLLETGADAMFVSRRSRRVHGETFRPEAFSRAGAKSRSSPISSRGNRSRKRR